MISFLGDRTSKSIDVVLATSTATKMSLLNASPAAIAETNWNFVNQLLREAKTKTKRILLEKLGQAHHMFSRFLNLRIYDF